MERLSMPLYPASLAEAIKEYVLTAIENGTIQLLYDPSRGKYWKAFKEIEKKRSIALLNQSIKTSLDNDYLQAINSFSHFRHLAAHPLEMAEQVCERVVTLPLYPGLSCNDCNTVCQAIHDFFGTRSTAHL